MVPPEELTIRYKGGRQWVTLRALSAELKKMDQPGASRKRRIFVWGWQSPLYFYTGFDGVSRQVFVDPLIKAYATSDHPLIRPRIDRIMRELHENEPDIIFAGNPPFPALRQFLYERYFRSPLVPLSPDGSGLWFLREPTGKR
jgi:hypothetical protein